MRRTSRVFARLLLVSSLVTGGLAIVQGATTTATAASGATATVTATRTYFAQDGTQTQVSSNTVTLDVDTTQNLRGRQTLRVTWSGAIPTRAVYSDVNAPKAARQEYPFVLVQCRGNAATISPETCWTQSSSERFFAGSSTSAWRSDAFATPANRQSQVGVPSPRPAACGSANGAEWWLHFVAVDGTDYPAGADPLNVDPARQCGKLPPEAGEGDGTGVPGNMTYGTTLADGTGSTDFAVLSNQENQSLGCSATVECALVAIPIVGISCDPYGTTLPQGEALVTNSGAPINTATAIDNCEQTGNYPPGQKLEDSQATQLSVSGALWWSASNWRNRIVVPLSFAPTADVCSVVSSEAPLQVVGSPAAAELADSWAPTFCTDKRLFNFTLVQQPESEAVGQVAAGANAVGIGVAPPPDEDDSVTEAPVGVTGFAIAFWINDASGARVDHLKLNARLVAKLLTDSYPDNTLTQAERPELAGNPLNLSEDPEFQALNPGLLQHSALPSATALQILNTDSDLMRALTSWLDADPEARAFLDGYPDPWGMKVNTNYVRADLPVDTWELSDLRQPPASTIAASRCLQASRTTWQTLMVNPVASYATIEENQQYALSQVLSVCQTSDVNSSIAILKREGRQQSGFRFVLGLVPLSAAERYNLRTAALQTTSTVPVGDRFTNADGRAFVAADDEGLKAAANLLKPSGGGWWLDYSALHKASGAEAYPGTVPLAAVVGADLSAANTTKASKLLCYALREGTASGTASGQMPPGYLPLTEGNGLGQLRSATVAAVQRLRGSEQADLDRLCDFTEPAPPASTSTPTPKPRPRTATTPVVAPAVAAPAPVAPPAVAPVQVSEEPEAAPVVAQIATVGQYSRAGAVGGPLLLVSVGLSFIAGAWLRWQEVILRWLSSHALRRPGA